ncbi:hypothetical protein V5O48_017325 [Marasmius crinis-equi]|uniref:Prolyl 4-hydroxylase alpha subunit Fe(2+) 2OG dioxygenase domain-containing protein n=1 Tax=Marasmius crinis-equi TaxID=585013 RepID=A0ABR3EPA9_9AGAR
MRIATHQGHAKTIERPEDELHRSKAGVDWASTRSRSARIHVEGNFGRTRDDKGGMGQHQVWFLLLSSYPLSLITARETRILKAGSQHGLGVLGGWPDDEWGLLIGRVRTLLSTLRTKLHLKRSMKEGRRGVFDAITAGISLGCGQQVPMQFSHSEHNAALLDEFFANPDVQRIARSQEYLLQAFYGKLHALYTWVLDRVIEDGEGLKRNYPKTCFAATTLNMDRACTLKHVDHLNLFCGLCAVFNVGDFDYEKGGHLVLWDLGLVLEFPPGCTVLFPSVLIAHSNTPIEVHETRSSITQFTAAGLFRWVHNGCMTDKEYGQYANVRQKKARAQHRENLSSMGLDLLSL